jgi:type I restriction enzyme S subunit
VPGCIFTATVLATLPVRTAYQGESFFARGAATGDNELPQKSAPEINMAELVEPQVSRYQKYKPTGVEWMSDIPAGWDVKKLKFVATINPSRDSSKLEESAESVIFLPMEAVGEDGSFRQDTFKALADVQSGYTYFEQDDVLLAKITPCFENGKATVLTGLLTPIGFGSTEFHVVRPKQGLTISRFLFYTVKSELFLRLGEGVMVGSAGQKRVPTDFLTEFPLPVPSLEEQEAIVSFLNDKTAQLDQLITQKQQMLELLREERAALINHAVTKGLNAAAPLRDSGVEWLGPVPTHWEVKQLKHITSLIQTGPFGSQLHAEDYVDNGIPVINPAHLQDGLIVPSQKVTVSEETRDKLERHILVEGDIVFARRGEMGRCALVTKESAGWLCGTGSLKVTLITSLVSPEFLFRILSNHGIKELLSLESVGSTMDNLNTDILSRIRIPLPSMHEQAEIVEYLRDKEQELALVSDTINQEIALLQEYRAALIAEVVTGQIDVRDYAPVAAVLV